MTKTYDSVIIGAGHNGLVCAAYLAKAGQSVLVLEVNAFLGGAASTGEFFPGFKASRVAHLLHGFPSSVIDELNLHQHGLQFAASHICTHALNDTSAPAVQISRGDVAHLPDECAADRLRYRQFIEQMDRFASVLQVLNEQSPSRIIPSNWRERWQLLKAGIKLRLLGRDEMREFLRIAGMNVYDLLQEKFQSDVLKGALAFDATLGADQGPRSPGTVLNYLQRWAAQRDAARHGTVQINGGVGALSSAIAHSAQQAGAEIRLSVRVKRVLVENDRACGVELDSGEQVLAQHIISNSDPKTSYLHLLGVRHLDTGFVRRIAHYRCKGLTAKLHLALTQLPVFKSLAATALGQRLVIAPSLNFVEQAFNPSKYGELPSQPVMELHFPTVNDASLAPSGQHVMSAIVQFVPFTLRDANVDTRAQFVQNLLTELELYAPGLSKLVLHAELLFPGDIAEQFNLHGGHWHHGALAFDQFYFTRPVPGAAQYQSPVAGFYLCGAGQHPGGGVMGIAGQLAAQCVISQHVKLAATVKTGVST